MMGAKAVIFDMDGVIIDSEGLWRQAQKEALAGWRAEVSDEECESLTKGKRLDEIARTWCEHCRLEADPALIEAAIRLRIIELISREGKAIEGVYDVMTYFREAGYRIALATSSSYEIVHAVLEKLSIGHYFEVICSADDERYGKPHPAVYFSALRKLGLAASQCIVVEDSLSGYRAALSAGLKTLVVSPACHHASFKDAIGRYASMHALLETLAVPVPEAG
ncbi:HAD family hydrolase [Enterobacter huaxiensis]|uniref:HAD family hydrolase n=1 Tax=Enterobacter huaxiensis TaxID=2494702 RepID=A0A428LXS0_9ENTR|nr:HAD-IA family hydrolase [Enterobacter huaxiensis]RSK70197.1 HAD family hydrolase [Enterobacter huaxiensis]